MPVQGSMEDKAADANDRYPRMGECVSVAVWQAFLVCAHDAVKTEEDEGNVGQGIVELGEVWGVGVVVL